MMRRNSKVFIFTIGFLCMLVALALQNITLANGHYGKVLFTAMALTIAADVCLAAVAWLPGTGWRVASILSMMPTVFIFCDILSRAPYIF